jgi:23S rRNA (uridine2552-2'-O)-methyltransferase
VFWASVYFFLEGFVGDRRRGDHWSRKASSQGYSARSAYKLEEIEKRFKIVPRNGRVVDLGCFPGSWTEYIFRVGGPDTRAVGVDLNEVPGYRGTMLKASVFDVIDEQLLTALGGPADLVVSDMAPSTTGSRFTDHVRQVELAESARIIATRVLRPGGHFVAKVFDGEDARPFIERVRRDFEKTKRLKPKATRPESVEFFVIGLGRKTQ